MTDYVQKTIERLTKLDPAYGSQAHQRDAMDRWRRMQQLHPCTHNHDADAPPEHRYVDTLDEKGKLATLSCYPFHNCCQSRGVHRDGCRG